MEADGLVEGFRKSEELYGVRFATLIADGDSSTYKRILNARSYKNLTVQKIECSNHLLRNFCNKLTALSKDTRFPIKYRKFVTKNILRFRKAINGAVEFRKQERNESAVYLLKKDIDNSLNHIFGNHAMCDTYFCKPKNEYDYISEIKTQCPELYCRLNEIISSISNHSRSLLEKVNSNIVEQFHAIIAKFVGGKRINFSQKRSYQTRCQGAVISFNSNRIHSLVSKTHPFAHKNLNVENLEKRRRRSRENAKKLKLMGKKKTKLQKSQIDDEDYGDNSLKPDLDTDILEQEINKFLKNMERTSTQREYLERNSTLQAESGYWLEERRKLLTASNFYPVCIRKDTTLCANLVKRILYYCGTAIKSKAVQHGRNNEGIALRQLEVQENVKIKKCGLFVDSQYCFLGATPDGLVGDDLVVEVKCPFSAYKTCPEEAIKQKKINFWTFNATSNTFDINKKDKWFYQIQGQLQITGRKGCLFAIWTGHNIPMKVAYIRRDKQFWRTNMEIKLLRFYKECMLPELVDPRHTRHLPIREPNFIKAAQINRKRPRNQ
nr:uncharacterized protein LOC111422121 [Onthophagus taurus]